MSLVAKYVDNGPMEGFWGILKRERYYGKRFTRRDVLIQMITDYIDYYNHKRHQRNLGVLTPMEISKNADNTKSSAFQNFILFHCHLTGERFKTGVRLFCLIN